MEVNLHALEGIGITGDSITLPDEIFRTVLTENFNGLLEPKKDINGVTGVDGGLLKQSCYGLSTLILEAARRNSDESSISSLLEECKWTPDRVEFFCKMFQLHKKDLQIILARIDTQNPHIVNVEWRLDYCIKYRQILLLPISNHLEKINNSSYFISLKTQEPGKDDSNLKFSCTVEQLQDLVNKLKDATKSLEKACQS